MEQMQFFCITYRLDVGAILDDGWVYLNAIAGSKSMPMGIVPGVGVFLEFPTIAEIKISLGLAGLGDCPIYTPNPEIRSSGWTAKFPATFVDDPCKMRRVG